MTEERGMETNKLIDAATKQADLYNDDDRQDIKTDVMNAFFAGAKFKDQGLREENDALKAEVAELKRRVKVFEAKDAHPVINVTDHSLADSMEIAALRTQLEEARRGTELSLDPDGDVSIDWLTPDRDMLSISVSPEGRIIFAVLLADGTNCDGVSSLPPEAFTVLRKLVEDEQTC